MDRLSKRWSTVLHVVCLTWMTVASMSESLPTATASPALQRQQMATHDGFANSAIVDEAGASSTTGYMQSMQLNACATHTR